MHRMGRGLRSPPPPPLFFCGGGGGGESGLTCDMESVGFRLGGGLEDVVVVGVCRALMTAVHRAGPR